jgi:hypothetical protein
MDPQSIIDATAAAKSRDEYGNGDIGGSCSTGHMSTSAGRGAPTDADARMGIEAVISDPEFHQFLQFVAQSGQHELPRDTPRVVLEVLGNNLQECVAKLQMDKEGRLAEQKRALADIFARGGLDPATRHQQTNQVLCRTQSAVRLIHEELESRQKLYRLQEQICNEQFRQNQQEQQQQQQLAAAAVQQQQEQWRQQIFLAQQQQQQQQVQQQHQHLYQQQLMQQQQQQQMGMGMGMGQMMMGGGAMGGGAMRGDVMGAGVGMPPLRPPPPPPPPKQGGAL